jgi:hypothetical protein
MKSAHYYDKIDLPVRLGKVDMVKPYVHQVHAIENKCSFFFHCAIIGYFGKTVINKFRQKALLLFKAN